MRVDRRHVKQAVVADERDRGRLNLEQPDALSTMVSNTGAASDDRVGDDTQDLGRGGLPLERLLGLVEQPHVLDRHHGLAGEGLEQRDGRPGNNPGSLRATPMVPIERPSCSSGTDMMLRNPIRRACSARSAP